VLALDFQGEDGIWGYLMSHCQGHRFKYCWRWPIIKIGQQSLLYGERFSASLISTWN